MRNKKDLWIEMSIREIGTQCHFAEISFNNINPKAERATDAVFSSIHSFLSHCALVSKLLRAQDNNNPPTIIYQILEVQNTSVIHNRTFRDHLDHYYDRLKRWIEKYPPNINIGTYNIGSKRNFHGNNMLLVSHYDPATEVFTFVDEDLNLREMYEEVSKIKTMADNWIKSLRQSSF
jgi:hypothetical protein